MKKARLAILLLVACALSTALFAAQRGRFRGGAGPLSSYYQRPDPKTEFAIARWHSPNWTSDGWGHDWPASEEHILQIMNEVSVIDTNHMSYKVVEVSSPEIFKYPFAYIS